MSQKRHSGIWKDISPATGQVSQKSTTGGMDTQMKRITDILDILIYIIHMG